MNVLMLGNGFDINYGLPTKYINFLNTVAFVAQIDELPRSIGAVFGNTELQKIDKEIAKSYSKYADVYNSLSLSPALVEKFKVLAQHNLWFTYLKKSFDKDIGWIDFEREIATVLRGIQICLPQLKSRFYGKDIPKDAIQQYVLRTFDFFYTKKNDAGVNSVGKHYDSEYSINDEFILEYPFGSGNKVINKEKIVGTFEKALHELADGLRLYLQYFVENAVSELCKRESVQPIAALSDAEYIITFNYTNTYEQVYREGTVFHIHGSLRNRIILGVDPDDSDRIETIDTLFLPFKKYYQRVINCSDAEYLDWLSNRREYICLVVMGHSLDATDQDVIKQMFELANDITVLYYNENAEASMVSNLVKIYGKEKFDELRLKKRLRFLLQTASYATFAEDRNAKEQAAIVRLYKDIR